MPYQFTSFLIPKNANTFFLLEDRYVKGGFQVRSDVADRDAIPPGNRKPGMLVWTQAEGKLWQLAGDSATWGEAQLGGGLQGVRQTVTYITQELQPNGFEDFSLALGKAALLLSLRVTVPVLVEAFSRMDRSDENPYSFLATNDHLADDGTTLMTDGSIYKNRRYSILANEEDPPTDAIPFRITNQGQLPTSTTLTISFIPLE